MLTAKQAYAIASQWGSYMHDGDPGAVFYSFSKDDAAPKDEVQRKALIEYTDSLLADVVHSIPVRKTEIDELNALRAFFVGAPLVPDDAFALAYLTAALWSSTDQSDESGGLPLDQNYTTVDIAPETRAEMLADCAKFQADNAADLDALENDDRVRLSSDGTGLRSHAGHDFWLTRNGHGAGFWDGDYPEPYATRLDDAANAFGEYDLYIGDDSRVHGE